LNSEKQQFDEELAEIIIKSAERQIKMIEQSNLDETIKTITKKRFTSIISITVSNTKQIPEENSVIAKYQAQKKSKLQRELERVKRLKIQSIKTPIVKEQPRVRVDTIAE
jgi:hypothetical protein